MHALKAFDAWAYLSDSTDQGIENPRVGGSIPPPVTTLQNNINGLILHTNAMRVRFKNTPNTLFHVFLCGISGFDTGLQQGRWQSYLDK